MVAFRGENPTSSGFKKEVSLGYGYPRWGNILHQPLSASGGGVKVTANLVAGGSIWELWWGGEQLINDYDFGRQIQVAFNLTNKAEVDNPTEAGSKYATASLGVYRWAGQKNYGLCRFTSGAGGQYGFSTTKWNLLERHGNGVAAGTQVWTAYLVAGTVQGCVKAMDDLYKKGY